MTRHRFISSVNKEKDASLSPRQSTNARKGHRPFLGFEVRASKSFSAISVPLLEVLPPYETSYRARPIESSLRYKIRPAVSQLIKDNPGFDIS